MNIMVLGFLISDLDIKLKKTQNYIFQIFLHMKMEMKLIQNKSLNQNYFEVEELEVYKILF